MIVMYKYIYILSKFIDPRFRKNCYYIYITLYISYTHTINQKAPDAPATLLIEIILILDILPNSFYIFISIFCILYISKG